MIETTRTMAGYRLWIELCKQMSAEAAIEEVRRRVQVRTTPIVLDAVRVETSTDGGAWVDEGLYRVREEP
jgi:hypothetical protein